MLGEDDQFSHEDSSPSLIEEPEPKLELKEPEEPSQNVANNIPILYKASVHFNKIVFMNPKKCFPTGTKFQFQFLNLPEMCIKIGQCKSIVFPLSIKDAANITNANLELIAVYGDQLIASGTIELEEQLARVISTVVESRRFDASDCRQEILLLFAGDPVLAEATMTVEIKCLGGMEVEEVPEEKLPIPWNVAGVEDETQEEYDEFSAEINGHSLNVKVLKKPKKKKKVTDELCDCDYSSPQHFQNMASGTASGGVSKNGNQVVFQIPSNQALCNKGAQNVVAYNAGSCQEGNKHGHGQDKIKVLSGNSGDPEVDAAGTFLIKIGKKGEGENGKGRLQLELKAPRPLTAQDFKKPIRDAYVQTNPEVKSKAKTKKK